MEYEKSDRIRKLTPEGKAVYDKWVDKLPICPLLQYLKYCVNVIGILADHIADEMTEEKTEAFLCEFIILMTNPPKAFRTVDSLSRIAMITNACLLIADWHEKGGHIAGFYENVFRITIMSKKKHPRHAVMTFYECAAEIDFFEAETYSGGNIPTC